RHTRDGGRSAVTRESPLALTSQRRQELAPPHPVNSEAFDAYLQGNYHFRLNTEKDDEMAGRYFERAIELDPSYALAWVGFSRIRKWQAVRGLIPQAEGYRVARDAVERALSLSPSLADAHMQLGRIKQQIDFDWAGADASYQRAVTLSPGSPEALDQAARSAAMLGRLDEAIKLNRRTVDLDP